jgi:hypothetical protein
LPNFTNHKALRLKRFKKILKWVLLSLLLLIIAVVILVNTPWGQNFIVKQVTSRFSKKLNATFHISRVSFSLFNKMNLEGVLVEDQKKDTLLFAGRVQVKITDWFFFKDKAELKYAGLENAIIRLNRTDSIWNYKFLQDYFSGGGSSGSKEGLELNLKKLELKNISLIKRDAWLGQDMLVQLKALDLAADEINFSTKKVDITSLNFTEPLFWLKNYPKLKPPSIKKPAAENGNEEIKIDSLLKWNSAGWLVHIDKLNIREGNFKNDKQSDAPVPDYFDGRHVDFGAINGIFTNVNWIKDTITAAMELKTKERSGFEVKSMKADMKMIPAGMAFSNMEIQTNNSVIRDFFSMTYDDMNDLGYFISRVRMQANFSEAEIDSDDIAFFAPALKDWKKKIKISGNTRGTVDDLFGTDMNIIAGQNTILNGDISLTGLPDINQTFIDFKANDFRTNYTDAVTFIPSIRNMKGVGLQNISYLHFTGSFTGFLRDFVTFGAIRTNLGTVTSDLNMKLPSGKEPFYSGNIASDNFNLGRFINNSSIGQISFNGKVVGRGVKWNTLTADLDGNISQLVYNNYHYENIKAKGLLDKKVFGGIFSIKDSNAVATLEGMVDLSGKLPRFDFVAGVEKLNLRKLHLSEDDYSVKGKFDFDFSSDNIDNFLGDARITDGVITKDGKSVPVESLTVNSKYIDGVKHLTINTNELEGSITGDFSISNLPDAFKLFLNKYYPAYIKEPRGKIRNQAFAFDIKTRYINDYINLFDTSLQGFSNSHISGKLNSIANQMELNVDVPSFAYKDYQFGNINITGKGDLQKLELTGQVDQVQINDSLSFPYTKIKISSQNDISDIDVVTVSSNKNITQGAIKARVQTFNDGLAVRFDSSKFVVNGKTWTVDKDGKLVLRSSIVSSSEIFLRESNQVVTVKTQPSGIGDWNDIKIDLKNFNIGDVTPYLVKSNRIEGLLSGDITIENPVKSFNITSDLQAEQLWLDKDSLGQATAQVFYNNKTGELKVNGGKMNTDEKLNFDLAYFLKKDDVRDDIITITPENHPIKIVERFIGTLFTDLQGYGTGQLKIIGSGGNQKYVGKIKLNDAGLKVLFTQCFYKIPDTEIEFKEDALDLGRIKLIDTLTKNTATMSKGIIRHDSWKNMVFDIRAVVDGRPIQLLNTTAKDNSSFYGKVKGTGFFSLTGPQSDMRMKIDGAASETDSSYITIPNSSSRESGIADFLVERKYGRELSDSVLRKAGTNLTYDVDITGNKMVNVRVVLDELTGDEIRGRGDGNLKIRSGTSEPLTIHGRYAIDEGNYLFTFQSFFKKPFELKKNGDNYIEWTGDPYHANVKIDAVYTTSKKVDFTKLINAGITGGNLAGFQDFVYVIARLRGDLFKPEISFALDFPPESPAKRDLSTSFVIDQVQNNENELRKHVAFLVVLNSFAPVDNAESSLNISSGVDFVVNSISGFLSSQINAWLNSFLSKTLKIPGLSINFSGSLYNPNPFGEGGTIPGYERTNFNFAIAKSILRNRAVITFEGNADVPFQTSTQVKADFLYNFTTEFLINKSGTIRATIFYKENVDVLSGGSTNSNAKSKRFGGSLAYRKESNTIWGLFKRSKKKSKIPETETTKNEGD